MAYNESRRSRERRLRARYRKKTAIVSILTLVLGLIVGFVGCAVGIRNVSGLSKALKIGPVDAVSAGVSATPEPIPEGPTVDSKDGTFADFALENADAINAFVAEEAAALQAFNQQPEGDFTDGSGEPDYVDVDLGDANEGEDPVSILADTGLQITSVEVTAAPVEAVPEETTAAAITPVETEAADAATAEPTQESTEAATAEPTQEPTPEVTEEPTQEPTPEPTEEPTPEPTEEPTPEPTPEATPEPLVIPYGEAYTFEAQITADGSERSEAGDDDFETLNITLKVDAYKDPAYFQEQYASQYKLQGDEAAVEFDITLNGYTGSTEIVPQNFLLITFIGEDPSIEAQGYQLMDAEIAGKTDISISPDVTATLYKRYPYATEQGDMVYMVVTAYNDGEENVYWFEILEPEPEETPAPEGDEDGNGSDASSDESNSSEGGTVLQKGSSGDEVKKLQRTLINLGLLQGTPDGKYGNYTAEAVKILQARYGMEQTGIADQAFLDRLYGNN